MENNEEGGNEESGDESGDDDLETNGLVNVANSISVSQTKFIKTAIGHLVVLNGKKAYSVALKVV
jgi:hypothetical protein